MPESREKGCLEERVFRCTDIYTMGVISGKWRLPIIWTLHLGTRMRYNELKRELRGITNVMLTRSLRGLEEYGLVTRTEREGTPPRVEYALTEKCEDLLPALEVINEWGKDLLKRHHDATNGNPDPSAK